MSSKRRPALAPSRVAQRDFASDSPVARASNELAHSGTRASDAPRGTLHSSAPIPRARARRDPRIHPPSPRIRFSRQDEERPRRHRDDVDERAVPARGHRRDHHSEDRRGLRRREGVVEDGHVGERGGSRVPRREHRVRSQGGRGQGGDATRSGARAQVQARRNGGERVHGRAREPREGRRALLGRAGRRRHRVTWVGASDARAEKGG